MKRETLAILVGFEIGFLLIFLLVPISIPCIFKGLLSIPCPGCGMTRAFYAFLEGHFIEAFTYNILFYPFMGFLLFVPIRLVMAIRKGESMINLSFFCKPVVIGFLVFLLLCSEIYNIVMGI